MMHDLLQPSKHCTAPGCRTNDTVTADGIHGRRCADHPPRFRPDYAVHLAVTGRVDTAFSYCRTDVAA